MSKSKFTFPVGYHDFHKDQLFNFQLNRWYSFGYARLEDMQEAGQKIENFADWKRELTQLAKKAVSEKRLMNAAFYYRAAEFYTFEQDPDKEPLYDKFSDLFYKVFKDDIGRFKVPYKKTFLPAMEVSPAGGKTKGTIVMFGGFDSYIEEFYSWMGYFADHGYKVVAFEGPGQGAARKKYGLALDYKWEKPTKAVLDYFKLDNVTLLGISMGGWFCFRAAAFEPRIKRVIASGVAFDYMQIPAVPLQWLMKLFLKSEGLMNYLSEMKIRKDPEHTWSIRNAMYITKTKTPMGAMKTFLQLNEKNLHSDLVKQDVLILTGAEDHFIPLKMHDMQVKALVNAKSVTGRIFTEKEQAQNHCQIGNTGLALDVMLKWLAEKS
ncbi:MAG: alpha/beta fold hydrolase [Chloroflexi bacterium]|nr:alpha/beta fold hydrolase [Chloroflexota bacterium]MBL7061296.1 alpha/beta fold hydrolase [Dehalococcoidia bacterium]